jgi:hypothetical protein
MNLPWSQWDGQGFRIITKCRYNDDRHPVFSSQLILGMHEEDEPRQTSSGYWKINHKLELQDK